MDGSDLFGRLRSARIDRRLVLAAGLGGSLATAAVVYGMLYDDPVTALSALLFVPAILLLVGIGLSTPRNDERQSGPGGTV
jgi:hypothetical protein